MKKHNTNSNSIHLGCDYIYECKKYKQIYDPTKCQIIHILFQPDFKFISIPQKCIKTEIEQIRPEMIISNNDLPL